MSTVIYSPEQKQKADKKLLTTVKIGIASGILCLVAAFAWYIAITGIIGIKKWDPSIYAVGPAVLLGAGIALLLANIILFFKHKKLKAASLPVKHDLKRDKHLYMLLIPGVVLVFIFRYLPMYGVVLGFKDYKIKSGILFSPWCGLDNFTRFFERRVASNVIWNTVYIGVTQLLITFPVPIILALLLNELHSNKFRRTVQSIIYMPHFISWIYVLTHFNTI